MNIRAWLPFQQAPIRTPKALAISDDTAVQKMFKVASLAVGFNRFSTINITGRNNFESPPHDFEQIIQAINTDSYAKQAFGKYKELMWKQGWDLVGSNPKAVDYIQNRLRLMEVAMGRPFQQFLTDVGDQLVKFGNAFIVRSRGDVGAFFKGPLKEGDGMPVLGYYLLPTEKIEIERTKNNKPLRYRQRLDETFDQSDPPIWKAADVIHLTWDRQPGTAFGIPFVAAAIDDILALRQVEEDVQNLVHRELFPLYKYTVGTELVPAEPDEIQSAANELANLRTDGGLVLPERHDVDVIGAANTALDATGYLQHFKERVALGLGLTPHHLGMTMNGGNRSMTQQLDTALYDKIKTYQKYLSDMIELTMLDELLLEGGFDPYRDVVSGDSDHVEFRFHEIDIDTQVKVETHILQLINSNVMTIPEGRDKLNLDNDHYDESHTVIALSTRMAIAAAAASPQPAPKPGGTTASGAPKPMIKPPEPHPAVKALVPKVTKQLDTKTRPQNQFGKRTSPDIRHDIDNDIDWIESITNLFEDEE